MTGGDLSWAPELDMSPLQPSEQQSWSSGGTAGVLPAERAKASFGVDNMQAALYGGAKGAAQRRFILSPLEKWSAGELAKYGMERADLMEASVRDVIGIHKPYTSKGWKAKHGEEFTWMGQAATNTGPLMPHLSLFITTLTGQCSEAQKRAWLQKAYKFEIIGGYAQTELGHGSNVRGLQTTARYDAATQEFVVDTPTLQSMKWWNSNLGCVATHCVLYAQLIVKGKEYGPHVFFVQLRDEEHRPLPGVELGDVGPKMGDDAIDTGFVRFRGLRVPRVHMLAKRAYVDAGGNYVRAGGGGGGRGADPKRAAIAERLHYLTMMSARSSMIGGAGGKLQIAATIATRYSLVRHQGFADTRTGQSFAAKEQQILDYQVQAFRVLRQVALAYAIAFTGKWMNSTFRSLVAKLMTGDANAGADLPEVHASSAGLKALCCMMVSDGMEDLRKCCGGHGYLLSAGIGPHWADWVWQVTAEGDPVVMHLQTARYLMKQAEAARRGDKVGGLCEYLSALRDPSFDATAGLPSAATAEEVGRLDTLRALFRARAAASVDSAERQLQEELRGGAPRDAAWNQCAAALVAASEHHCAYFMLAKLLDTVPAVADAPCRAALERLARLHALADLTHGAGWVGVAPRASVAAAHRATRRVLLELRPDACALVDAFALPDRVLNSALGRQDGNVYEALFDHARRSALNRRAPFQGYSAHLRPHLDRSFLRLRNAPTPGLADPGTPAGAKL